MKLSTRDAVSYFTNPDPKRTGLLIYGADPMRVALKRQEIIAALLGPNAEEEMRLMRMSAAEVRKDPAMLQDALKSQGFFPGPRVAFVEDANDTIAPIIIAALAEWQTGDAQVVVTAGALKKTSKIRKEFETHPNAFAAALYDEPMSRAEIENELKRAELTVSGDDAMTALTGLARTLEPGDFRQTLEKLSLYKRNDPSPISSEDIDNCAPATQDADLDDILNIIAEGQTRNIGPVLRRLKSQGVQPVGLCIGANRHFRTLYTVVSDPGGVSAGMGKLRPPVFGPRRDKVQRQASRWNSDRLQTALAMITDTDLQLRSANQHAPAMELVERMMVRLSMMVR